MTREEWNEYHRKYREKHREKLKEYNRKYWQWYKTIRRKRYRDDPEYRQKELERKAKQSKAK